MALARVLLVVVRTDPIVCERLSNEPLRQRLGNHLFGLKNACDPPEGHVGVSHIDPAALFTACAGVVAWSKGEAEINALARLCALLAVFQGTLRLVGKRVGDAPPQVDSSLPADSSFASVLSAMLGRVVSDEVAESALDSSSHLLGAIAMMRSAVLNKECDPGVATWVSSSCFCFFSLLFFCMCC